MEMDAASPHRRRTTSAKSSTPSTIGPASARYKVYIIDEVHMLSTAPSTRC
jgi:DNA polymerase III gamma/tau subunit